VGRNKFTRAQFEILRHTLDKLTINHGIPDWEIYTHNEFDELKTCPNIPIKNLLVWYLDAVYCPISKNILDPV